MDYHLQPINKSLPSYVQDTTDLLKKLENVPDDPREETILVTMDVRSLYTNIPNEEGIEAIKSYFQARASPGDRILSKVICTFLRLILMLNNFVFNGTNYIQINGASMGTKCAPTYASLFMGRFEQQKILPRIRDKLLLYVRYIDDLFFIWKGSEEDLLKFLKEVNTLHPSIKFDYEYSREKVNFLDTTISVIGNKFSTTLYTKPTDRKSYLHSKSYHPQSTKKSIAFSQAARLKRICTEERDFQQHAEKLKLDLINRGYRPSTISEGIERAANLERRTLLTYKERNNEERTPLIVTYNRDLPNLKEKLDETWPLLQINPTKKQKFTAKPIVCYRRNKNLRDIIGQTKIVNNRVARKRTILRGRCAPCRSRPDAKCCNHILTTDYFTDQTCEKRFYIRHKVGCKTKNAIYLGFCIK